MGRRLGFLERPVSSPCFGYICILVLVEFLHVVMIIVVVIVVIVINRCMKELFNPSLSSFYSLPFNSGANSTGRGYRVASIHSRVIPLRRLCQKLRDGGTSLNWWQKSSVWWRLIQSVKNSKRAKGRRALFLLSLRNGQLQVFAERVGLQV